MIVLRVAVINHRNPIRTNNNANPREVGNARMGWVREAGYTVEPEGGQAPRFLPRVIGILVRTNDVSLAPEPTTE
jgi:hypothetical protein